MSREDGPCGSSPADVRSGSPGNDETGTSRVVVPAKKDFSAARIFRIDPAGGAFSGSTNQNFFPPIRQIAEIREGSQNMLIPPRVTCVEQRHGYHEATEPPDRTETNNRLIISS